MSDLKADLDSFAADILKKAREKDVSLEDQIRAFKTVGAYHLGSTKMNKKAGGADDDTGFTFDDAKDEIDAATGRAN